jgi:hypothetical protein
VEGEKVKEVIVAEEKVKKKCSRAEREENIIIFSR